MEADISIWRKTGHFYFALTRTDTNGREPNSPEPIHQFTGEELQVKFSEAFL